MVRRLLVLPWFLLAFALQSPSARAAAIGNWDLSPWSYSSGGSPSSITTSVIQSDGTPSVGLSANTTGSGNTFLSGSATGRATGGTFQVIPASGQYQYSYSGTFSFSAPVDFGLPSTQSQFNSSPPDNGIGLQIRTEDSSFIIRYHLVFGLSGGGIFAAFGGSPGGFGPPSGVGTSSVTVDWLGGPGAEQGLASFDRIQVSGNVQSFTISHEVTYENTSGGTIDAINVADVKINTIPEPGSVTLAYCGLSMAFWIRPKRRSTVMAWPRLRKRRSPHRRRVGAGEPIRVSLGGS